MPCFHCKLLANGVGWDGMGGLGWMDGWMDGLEIGLWNFCPTN